MLDGPAELLLPTRNPLFMRSLRSKMRGGRFYLFLVVYQIALVLVLSGVGLYTFTQQAIAFMGSVEAAAIGRALFLSLVFTQGALLYLFTPLATANFLSGERERRSLELLQLTVLRNVSIVSGEMLGTLCYVFLLTFASLPIASVCLMIGGVSVADILIAEAALLLLSFYGLAIGLFCSAIFQKRILALLAALTVTMAAGFSLVLLDDPDTSFLAAWSPLAAVPSFLQVKADIDYFGRATPIWQPAFANAALLTGLLLVIAARLTRDSGRAWLGIPSLGLALALAGGHLAGGTWTFPHPSAGPIYNMLLLLTGGILLAFAFGRHRPTGPAGSGWRGGESPHGLAWCVAMVTVLTGVYAAFRGPRTATQVAAATEMATVREVAATMEVTNWAGFAVVAAVMLFALWAFGRLVQRLESRRFPACLTMLAALAMAAVVMPGISGVVFMPGRGEPTANAVTSAIMALSPALMPFFVGLDTFPGVWARAALRWVPSVSILKSPLFLPFAFYLSAGAICLWAEAALRRRRRASEAALAGRGAGPAVP